MVNVNPVTRVKVDQAIENGVIAVKHLSLEAESCGRSIFVYSLLKGNHTQTGLVAAVQASDYLSGVIKKHEGTISSTCHPCNGSSKNVR